MHSEKGYNLNWWHFRNSFVCSIYWKRINCKGSARLNHLSVIKANAFYKKVTCEQNETAYTCSISENRLSVQFIEKESTVSGVLVAADA